MPVTWTTGFWISCSKNGKPGVSVIWDSPYHGDIKVFDYLLSRHDEYQWDFVQIQLNYLDWRHAKEINERNTNAEYLYDELAKRKIPAVIMEPLLGGRLSKVHDHVVARLKQREPERSVASWAFRFAGTFPGVLTVLSGMTYMEHLEDNLHTYCPLQPLTDEEMTFLFDTADLMMQYPTVPCNDCKYCMPCPMALIFRLFWYIITSASIRVTCRKVRKKRTTGRRAVLFW